jgi:hypothetical protein
MGDEHWYMVTYASLVAMGETTKEQLWLLCPVAKCDEGIIAFWVCSYSIVP